MLERNIPLLYVYSISVKRIVMPFLILYYLFFELTFTQIGIIGAATGITAMLLEVQGGLFADKYGRKSSMFLGGIFGFLTFVFLYFGNSFWPFLIAGILYGISGSFLSGTRQSILYDTLKNLKREKEFKKYSGRMILYPHVTNALFLLIAPLIYAYNSKLPFAIMIGFYVVTMVSALMMIEPKIKKEKHNGYRNAFKKAILEIKRSPVVLSVILMSTISSAFIWTSADYTQPLLEITSLDIIYFGVVYAAFRIVMGLSAELVHRVEKKINNVQGIFIGLIMILISFVIFYLTQSIWLMVLGQILIRAASGWNRVYIGEEINQRIKPSQRTTILSIESLIQSLLAAILGVTFGVLADAYGVQAMYAFVIGSFLILATWAYSNYKTKTNNSLAIS
jgi:MFS family permease